MHLVQCPVTHTLRTPSLLPGQGDWLDRTRGAEDTARAHPPPKPLSAQQAKQAGGALRQVLALPHLPVTCPEGQVSWGLQEELPLPSVPSHHSPSPAPGKLGGLRGAACTRVKHTQTKNKDTSFLQGFPDSEGQLDRGPEGRPLGRKRDQGQRDRASQAAQRALYSLPFIGTTGVAAGHRDAHPGQLPPGESHFREAGKRRPKPQEKEGRIGVTSCCPAFDSWVVFSRLWCRPVCRVTGYDGGRRGHPSGPPPAAGAPPRGTSGPSTECGLGWGSALTSF